MRERNFYRGDLNQFRNFREQGDYKQFREQRHRNRMFFGMTIVVIGLVLMLTTMRVLPCIDLEFSWPGILIVVGILLGIKTGFRTSAWWILIVIGIANYTPQFMFMGRPSRDFAWPAIVIIVGLAILLRPKREKFRHAKGNVTSAINNESSFNIDVTFGGRKEVITSKDFKGGNVAVTFAGCEINLTQADFNESSAVIDCRVSFGGVEIIVPSHWDIQNEISPSFGSVDDERTIQTPTTGENRKTLILRGSCSFGSIEIKSF